MKVIYALEDFPKEMLKSVFLVGPTPRSKDVKSWRPEALRILEEMGYDGVVFSPERRSGEVKANYDDQVEWETKGLEMADCIICWVPRDMKTMPALSTNVEFGSWYKSGKLVFGAPDTAEKVRYLKLLGEKYFVPQENTLKGTIERAFEMIGKGALRKGGECQVPLYVWNTPSYQSWYEAQKSAGNRLDGAKVEWLFRVGPQKKIIFMWIMHVNVYVAKENRNKSNEIIIARPDISSVLLFKKSNELLSSSVILVREFRSPASNLECFVRELPGGSSFKPGKDPLILASDEVFEETGLRIDPKRMKKICERQLVATLSTHKAHLFSAEITNEELEWFIERAGIKNGQEGDSEQTYVEVKTVKEILSEDFIDWSTRGMILSVMIENFSI